MTTADRVATLGGLGRIVPAPGTVASFLTLFLAWVLVAVQGQWLVLGGAFCVTGVGFWGAEFYARTHNAKDPSECIIDEVAGQLLACAFTPRVLGLYLLAFLLFRLFDIVKPWPISAAERLPGGFGIMSDDLIAGFLSGIIMLVVVRLL